MHQRSEDDGEDDDRNEAEETSDKGKWDEDIGEVGPAISVVLPVLSSEVTGGLISKEFLCVSGSGWRSTVWQRIIVSGIRITIGSLEHDGLEVLTVPELLVIQSAVSHLIRPLVPSRFVIDITFGALVRDCFIDGTMGLVPGVP